MKVKEVADSLRGAYLYIDEDLYRTVDVPEDIGNKEVDFMYIITDGIMTLHEDRYLAVITKK